MPSEFVCHGKLEKEKKTWLHSTFSLRISAPVCPLCRFTLRARHVGSPKASDNLYFELSGLYPVDCSVFCLHFTAELTELVLFTQSSSAIMTVGSHISDSVCLHVQLCVCVLVGGLSAWINERNTFRHCVQVYGICASRIVSWPGRGGTWMDGWTFVLLGKLWTVPVTDICGLFSQHPSCSFVGSR